MLKKLKPKSEFSKNVLTLITGTTIAHVLPIAISPILTRLYTPEDFGILALYMSIISILGVIVTGQYELAIMLPKNNKNALNIFFLSIISTVFISIITFIIMFVFNDAITCLLHNKEISSWLYLVPFSILLIGLFNSFNYLFNRKKSYRLLAKTKIIQSFINSGNNLGFGFLQLNNIGLIISSFLAQLAAVLFFIKNFDFKNINFFHKTKILALAKKYKKFPKIMMPHAIFSSFSNNLPIFIITKYFTSADVGFYFFGNKIVAIPIGLISNAYYQVFFQAFSQEKNKQTFYKQKFREVNMIFLPLFMIFWFILPDIFAFVFSTQWKIAGEYSQIMLPLFYMKFLSNLFTTTTYIYYQKQEENFILSVLITILTFISLMLGVYVDNIKIGLFSIVVSNGSIILLKLYRSYSFTKGNDVKNL